MRHVYAYNGYDASEEMLLGLGAGVSFSYDRDEELHTIPMAALEQARGSTFKPFPPQNLWFDYGFQGFHPPRADEMRLAIAEKTPFCRSW